MSNGNTHTPTNYSFFYYFYYYIRLANFCCDPLPTFASCNGRLRFVANRCNLQKLHTKNGFPKEPKGMLMPKLKDCLKVTLTGLEYLYLSPAEQAGRSVRLQRTLPEKAQPRHESPERDAPLSLAKSPE